MARASETKVRYCIVKSEQGMDAEGEKDSK